jgi:thiol-disulfide isomerase/thioredoxin
VKVAVAAFLVVATACTRDVGAASSPLTKRAVKAEDGPRTAQPTQASPAPAPQKSVEFVEDDIDRAMKSANGKVVFVDGWAPWCHTCLSMQRDVLSDPSLRSYEDRIVFAAVDTDKPEAASFVEKFPLKVWPTFFVIDPANQVALAEHGGSLSLDELKAFLDEALRTRDPAHAKEPQVKALLEGHALFARKDFAAAARAYVTAASLPGPRVPEAALGAMRAFKAAHDDKGCLDFGLKELGKFTTSASSSDFVQSVVTCATNAKDDAALAAAKTALVPLTEHPPAGASVDDKADALAILADIAEAQHDDAGFKAAHEKRLALLEADANAQSTPERARVHDYARLNSYVALGRGDDAVKLLTQRTQQFPSSYEAWARLASADHELHREDDALVACKKAIELSYGPRKLRYDTLLADIYDAKHDAPREREAVQKLVDDAKSLPLGQRDDDAITKAEARLGGLP